MHLKCLLFPLLAWLAVAGTTFGQVSSRDVKEAIERGVGYLQKQQQASGSWGDYPGHTGGLSALCTLALLSCGEPVDDPVVRRALLHLEGLSKPETTYAASLRIMAFVAADPKRYKEQIAGMVRWLETNQIKDGSTKGSWSYASRIGINGDGSNTQFAMLALHEAERAGVSADDSTWKLARDYWISNGIQKQDGAFVYDAQAAPTGSMTCAGTASLIIARERLSSGDASIVGDGLSCCSQGGDTDEKNEKAALAIEQGLNWLGAKFTVHTNPNTLGLRGVGKSYPHLLYWLYGVERVGRMSGRRFLSSHDWYREGADFLVSEQKKSIHGSWSGTGAAENNPIVGTSLALLFLSKGRRPVVVSKLRHSIDSNSPNNNDWDLHRHGIAHLTAHVEKLWRRDLTWQTIDANKATVEELMETPVLFISGSKELKLARDQKQAIKQYVEQGGFLFVEACDGNGCNGKQFDREFRELMVELFPDSELRKLPPDHAVWYAQERVDPKNLPVDPDFWLWGLDTCCRTGVVYCPRNLSCYWEVNHPYREAKVAQPLKGQIEAVMKIGGNVLAYATNRELKEKLDQPQVAVSDAGGKVPRGSLVIPKLSHGGGYDDAPSALGNLLRVMETKMEMRTDPQRRSFAAGDPKLFDYPILFAHGRRAFRFSASERKALETYLTRGGFLFADAICASEPFAASFKDEFKAIFPEANFVRIPADHVLFTEDLGGFDVKTVALRDPKLRVGDDPLAVRTTKTVPYLEALEIDGRIAVILSPYDLSCALERGASMECKGYVPVDAAKLGVNIVLYALQQ